RVPRLALGDEEVRRTAVAVIAGHPEGAAAPQPAPPDSWDARDDADVAIWTIRMDPGARWTLPPAAGRDTRRLLYFFRGDRLRVGSEALEGACVVEVRSGVPAELVNDGSAAAELLLLQGRPTGEPVAQYGPFVMNSQDEIRQALMDYRRTEFGGWPWPEDRKST